MIYLSKIRVLHFKLYVMATKRKNKKFDWSKQYDFDINKWLIEKQQYIDFKENPTAIIYTRVSDQKQVSDWNGLDSQEKKCRDWAKSQWIRIVEVFQDWWVSWAVMNRDWLEAAIQFLKEKNKDKPTINYFICSELSRISRSESRNDTDTIIKRIEDTKVEIYLASTWSNISKKWIADIMNTDLQIMMAKTERLQIRERSMAGSISKLYAWEWIFSAPVWYERICHRVDWKMKKELIKQEPQASIIKEWLELFANWVIQNQARLLDYFNEKQLKSNHHSAKPWKLTIPFVSRLFEYEKLYFYAWYIFYPNPDYWINSPVIAMHEPLITLSTMAKILDRLKEKWNNKWWIRKDTSAKFPLRWIIYCPCCWYPMTWRASKWKMWVYYDYYGCKRKDCNEKSNIWTAELHKEYEDLLKQFTAKPWMIKLIDKILSNVIKEKNKILWKESEQMKKQIERIDAEISWISNKIWKIENPDIIKSLEKDWTDLLEQKEKLQANMKDNSLTENDFNILYDRVKTMIIDPVAIRKVGSVELKKLEAWVLFGGKIYYEKNEGFQTPQISVLHSIISGVSTPLVSSGAGDETRTRNNLLGRQEL